MLLLHFFFFLEKKWKLLLHIRADCRVPWLRQRGIASSSLRAELELVSQESETTKQSCIALVESGVDLVAMPSWSARRWDNIGTMSFVIESDRVF